MVRAEITTSIVNEAERLLNDGLDCAALGNRLHISEYVVRLLAVERLRTLGQPQPVARTPHCIRPARQTLDAATVRMIQRMLDVGILSHNEIAREAGASRETVSRVAYGKRLVVNCEKPELNRGERFLRKPVRCKTCGVLVTVDPCRLCRNEEAAMLRLEIQRVTSGV